MQNPRPVIVFFIGLLCSQFLLRAQDRAMVDKMPDSLYRMLPDSLRPHNRGELSPAERNRVFIYADGHLVPRYENYLDGLVPGAEAELLQNTTIPQKIGTAYALGMYLNTVPGKSPAVYFRMVLSLAGRDKAYDRMAADAYCFIGFDFLYAGNYLSAYDCLRRFETLAGKNDTSAILRICDGYGFLYDRIQMYTQSLAQYEKMLMMPGLYEKWGYKPSIIKFSKASVYVHLYLKYNLSLYLDSCSAIIEDIMSHEKGDSLHWYGSCYLYKGIISVCRKSYARALDFIRLSLLPKFLSTDLYYKGPTKKYLYLALCLIKTGHYKKGKKILDSIHLKNDYQQNLLMANRILYEHARDNGEWKDALHYYEEYQLDLDSMNILGQQGIIIEANHKNETAQQQASIDSLRITNLQEKNRSQQIIGMSVIAALVLIISFYAAIRKQKARQAWEREALADRLQKMEELAQADNQRKEAEKEAAISDQRRAISNDMHDEVSGGLAALRFYIRDLKRHAEHVETKKVLGQVAEETAKIYNRARDFMHRLQKGETVVTSDVVDFMKGLSDTFVPGSNFHISTKVGEDIRNRLTAVQHKEIYLIIKEAVANTMKHSSATAMEIILYDKGNRAYFEISDNGREPFGNSTGLGIRSMQGRIKNLGGEILFSSGLSGMSISGHIPLKN